MAKATRSRLTEVRVRTASAGDTTHGRQLFDGLGSNGLYLHVTPAGAKCWVQQLMVPNAATGKSRRVRNRPRRLASDHARRGPQGGVRQPVYARRRPRPAGCEAPARARDGEGGTGPDVRWRDRRGDRAPPPHLEGCRHPRRAVSCLARTLRRRARPHPGVRGSPRADVMQVLAPALALGPGRGRHRPPTHQHRAPVGDRAGLPERRPGREARRRRRAGRADAPHRAPSCDVLRRGWSGGRRRARPIEAFPLRAGPRAHGPDRHRARTRHGARRGARLTSTPEPGRYRPGG